MRLDPRDRLGPTARVVDLLYVRGAAEETGLPAGCADLVSAANALHWFDLPRALVEIARIAASGGGPRCTGAAARSLRSTTSSMRS